jgi:hypothetical protein
MNYTSRMSKVITTICCINIHPFFFWLSEFGKYSHLAAQEFLDSPFTDKLLSMCKNNQQILVGIGFFC